MSVSQRFCSSTGRVRFDRRPMATSAIGLVAVAGGPRDSSLTRPSVPSSPASWPHHSAGGWLATELGPLLAATPHGPAVLGDMIGSPGELLETLTQPGTNWLLRCSSSTQSPRPRELVDLVHREPRRARVAERRDVLGGHDNAAASTARRRAAGTLRGAAASPGARCHASAQRALSGGASRASPCSIAS